MCGIAGILGPGAGDAGLLEKMALPLVHRGPDAAGVWLDPAAGIGMAHRRLSIVELTAAGAQPMISHDGRFVISYNGEIYNHVTIRGRLDAEGRNPNGGWRGHSDTEVLLEAIAHWGLEKALAEVVGMFAFALWDRRERKLTLVRDRFGEKPLYYGWMGRNLLFASELRSLLAIPGFRPVIARRAVASLASLGYIPAPLSIFEGVFKLPPASILQIDPDAAPRRDPPVGNTSDGGVRLRSYWSYVDEVAKGVADPFATRDEAVEEIADTLRRSVEDQLVADVPVGAFLSGGIDSSLVVALAQQCSTQPTRTFSIGFAETGFDEAPFARAVASHLGTRHEEHYVTSSEAREVLPLLPGIYDEPFADSSQIPTYLVSRFARGQVKVALSGDGGDELFGGYNRHVIGPKLWRSLERVPYPIRRLASPLDRLPDTVLSRLVRDHSGGAKAARVVRAFKMATRARTGGDVHRAFVDSWAFEPSPVLGMEDSLRDWPAIDEADLGRAMMTVDALTYLPGDILTKVDRAAMAVSLETRIPFLNHRVAAAAARIPVPFNITGRTGKGVLRTILARHIPLSLIDRPKSGFAIPVGQWIRGPLREFANDHLSEERLRRGGIFDVARVRRRYRDHLSGRRDESSALWPILMFEAWRDAFDLSA